MLIELNKLLNKLAKSDFSNEVNLHSVCFDIQEFLDIKTGDNAAVFFSSERKRSATLTTEQKFDILKSYVNCEVNSMLKLDMKLSRKQIDTFSDIFNRYETDLTDITLSVDTNEACTLDEFIFANYETHETFEDFLKSEMMQSIMKLDKNEIYDDKMHATVKRIS